MTKLQSILDEHFEDRIRKRGYQYFTAHRVRDLEINENVVTAIVEGSEDYWVEISFDDDLDPEYMECECPYNEEDNCKHLVALLYELERMDFFKQVDEDEHNSDKDNTINAVLPEKITVPQVLSVEEQERRARNNFLRFQEKITGLLPIPETVPSKTKYVLAFALSTNFQGTASSLHLLRQRLLKDGSIAESTYVYDVNFDNVEPLSIEERLVAAYLLKNSDQSNYFGDSFSLSEKRLKQSNNSVLESLAGREIYVSVGSKPYMKVNLLRERGHCSLNVEEMQGIITLKLGLFIGDRKIQSGEKIFTIHDEPLWVMTENEIFQVSNLTYLQLRTFMDNNSEINIPQLYLQYFEENLLPALAVQLPIQSSSYSVEEMEVQPVKKIFLEENETILIIRLIFGYGDVDLPCKASENISTIFKDKKIVKILRNRDEEDKAIALVNGMYVKTISEGVVTPRNNPVDFLFTNIPVFKENGFEVYGAADLKKYKVNTAKPKVAYSVSSGVDWFDLQANVDFDGIAVDFSTLIASIKAKKKYIELSDGSVGIIPEEWVNKFKQTISLGDVQDNAIRFSRVQASALDAFLGDRENSVRDNEFLEHMQKINSFESIKKQKIPKTFKGELRDYQKAGVDWFYFLQEFSFGGILADDMGLGKTVEVLAMLAKEKGKKNIPPSLIVAPTSVVFNWVNEAARFVPTLKILNHTGNQRIKSDHLHFEEYDIVLTSYGILLRDYELFNNQKFHYLILDESQKVKNPTSKTARLLKEFNATYRLCMTGTPVENNLNELWSQMAILNYGMLGSLKSFQEVFVNPIQKNNDQESAATLRKAIYPFILRRTKEVVAKELPPKTEVTTFCQMEPEQLKLYKIWKEAVRAEVFNEISKKGIKKAGFKIIEGLLRLRQICNHPRLVKKDYLKDSGKFEEFKEMLTEVIREDHKVLVFSQFVTMLEIMREFLDAEHIQYEYLTGSTMNREERVDNFQTNKDVKVFLISLKAGGFGLNLTAADYVFHYDPWWNPAVEAQATDRTHRIGQDKNVFVYKFITKDSVEEKILQLQDKKRELVRNVISTETGVLKNLTKEDIGILFE